MLNIFEIPLPDLPCIICVDEQCDFKLLTLENKDTIAHFAKYCDV